MNCLPLDSPLWQQLSHCYGSGADIPGWLRSLESGLVRLDRPPPQDREVVTTESRPITFAYPKFDPRLLDDMLWSALCHQYDVYSGTHAAVPHLVRIAQKAEHGLKIQLLDFAGFVEACSTKAPLPELREAYEASLQEARREILRTLPLATSEGELLSLLTGFVGASGCYQVAFVLTELAGKGSTPRDVHVRCSACDRSIWLRPDGPEFVTPIEPLQGDPAPWDGEDYSCANVGVWLPELAIRARFEDLAARLRLLLYGTSECPDCASRFVPLHYLHEGRRRDR